MRCRHTTLRSFDPLEPFATRHKEGCRCYEHESYGAKRLYIIPRHGSTSLHLSVYAALAKQGQGRSAWPSTILACSTPVSQTRYRVSEPYIPSAFLSPSPPSPSFIPSKHSASLPDVQGRYQGPCERTHRQADLHLRDLACRRRFSLRAGSCSPCHAKSTLKCGDRENTSPTVWQPSLHVAKSMTYSLPSLAASLAREGVHDTGARSPKSVIRTKRGANHAKVSSLWGSNPRPSDKIYNFNRSLTPYH